MQRDEISIEYVVDALQYTQPVR